LRTRPKADAIKFTVDQEQLKKSSSQAGTSKAATTKASPTTVAMLHTPVRSPAVAGLQSIDDEEGCLSCGA
jgi:hypothetical protein